MAPVKQRKVWCERLAAIQEELGNLNDHANRVKQFRAFYDAAPNRSLRSQLLRIIRREEAALAAALEKVNCESSLAAGENPLEDEPEEVDSHIIPLPAEVRPSQSQG